MYRCLVTLSLLLVAGTSAYMSVYGLKSVFVSSPIVIVCMGIGMETGKVLIVSYLYRKWMRLNRLSRSLYILIVFVLALLTSIEIIGFLSQCHMQSTRDLRITETALDSLKNKSAILKDQISVIEDTLAGLPASYVSRRIKERKIAGYDKIQARLLDLEKEKERLQIQAVKDREYAGPLFALAQIMGVNETDAVAGFIFLLVMVLEPLSIGLTIASTVIWAKPETLSMKKSNREISEQTVNEDLNAIFAKYHLTVSKLAGITGRRKIKTCEGWLNGETQIPERAMRDLMSWVKEKDLESTHAEKIASMAQ